MTTYRLKISLAEPFLPITELHRLIDVDGDMSFGELATHVGTVFGATMTDWQFLISRIKADNLAKLQAFDTVGVDSHVVVNDVNLNEKDYFYLNGGEFLYRIRIEKLSQKAGDTPFVLVKSVGELPKIDDLTADESSDDERQQALQFEALLLSALAVIVTDSEPVRFGELVEDGIADELVNRGWIRPCVSLSRRVKLTPAGENVLRETLERAGLMSSPASD